MRRLPSLLGKDSLQGKGPPTPEGNDMSTDDKILMMRADAWESGALGTDVTHAQRVDLDVEAQIDAALELQAISIRLPKVVIETFKMLASMHGVGYQPLMRDALCRFAESEMKQLLIGAVEQQRQSVRS
jgi:hypothetical protein